VLASKLFIPTPTRKLVTRPRLVERLNAGLQRKLTLISAPASFGKTTLAGEWVASCGRPAAWLSLDETDSDPSRFLSCLVAALRTIRADTGFDASSALQSQSPQPTESVLTALLNEISAAPGVILLMLGDYHLVDARPVDEALAFLVEHLPPQMHLAVATREDPDLPLARLRDLGVTLISIHTREEEMASNMQGVSAGAGVREGVKTVLTRDRKMVLSTLWIFALINYINADLFTAFFNPPTPGSVTM
jgi:LuxR family transcriptional regulator, maltose regulon positive regulatory protein